MTASKAIRAFLVAFAAFLLAAGAAAPAMAQEESAKVVLQGGNEMKAQARHFNEVASWQILYQCPALRCNEGAVHPSQALGEICHMDAEGYQWALVYNRANGHSGFVNRNNLVHKRSLGHCDNVGIPLYPNWDFPLYQCPADFCNKGEARIGHELRAECYIQGLGNTKWIWVYNRNNHHEGFFDDTVTHGLEVC